MAPSTIKEHLDTLVAAGLIKQVDKGMKWKYYRLTSKGKELLNPYEKKVWIVLATSILALGVTAYAIFSKLKNLGAVKVIENCIPEPIPGMENPAVLEKASNEFLRTPTAGAAEAMSNLTGCAMQSPDNKSLNCAGDSCYNMAKSLADEIGRNVSGAASAVSPDGTPPRRHFPTRQETTRSRDPR